MIPTNDIENDRLKLSVVMITYKHEQFIKKSIEGVLMQKTDFDFELILADDCSPDNTSNIVNDLLAKNNNQRCNVKYTRHEKNKGMMGNFIWALSQSKSKYIALCEGDDYWIDEYKLQKQIDFLESDFDFSLCFHQAKKINIVDEKHTIYPEISGNVFKSNDFFDIVTIPMASVVFRNNIKLPFLDNHSHPDFILLCSLLSNGYAYFLNEVMSIYTVHEGGTTFNHFNPTYLKNRINELKIESNFKGYDKIVSKEIGNLYVKHVLLLVDNFEKNITKTELIQYLINCIKIPKRSTFYFNAYKKLIKSTIKKTTRN